jgi:tRNA(fMet)-specific endonuclease VapC
LSAEILFDTNAAIAWIEDDAALYHALEQDVEPVVSIVTVGELEYGAANSARVEANRQRLVRALAAFTRITLDETTARIYGQIMVTLKKKGRPIPTNDVWIAALALQYSLPLLTRDRHFREVEGVDVRGW